MMTYVVKIKIQDILIDSEHVFPSTKYSEALLDFNTCVNIYKNKKDKIGSILLIQRENNSETILKSFTLPKRS